MLARVAARGPVGIRRFYAFMNDFENHASQFRNYYWRIRACRSSACLRYWYRKAAKEKGHLLALGYSLEVVRLYGLALRDTSREVRRVRFEQAFDEFQNGPKQLRLFP